MIRAVYSFFAGSEPVRFRSQYDLHESVERLRSITKGSVLGALSGEAAVGKVTEAEVSLQRVIPFVGNSFKPFFVGRFEAGASGIELVGRFTISRSTKIFSTIWLSFILLWTALATRAVIAKPSEWYFPLFGVGMLAAGAVILAVCKWFSRNDVDWLSNAIQVALSRGSPA
jgi:hypothetical protein